MANEVDCGPNTTGSFASYDPDSSSWKTYQRSLLGGLAEFSETWPRAGTIRNGIAYQRKPLAPLTGGTGCFLLPTLSANESKGSGRDRYEGSQNFHGSKASEGLRTCAEDPIYLNPLFGERMMGLPEGWTDLVTQ